MPVVQSLHALESLANLPPDVWERYDALNASIAHEFFAGAHAYRPVYLDLEDEVLARIVARLGIEGDGRQTLIDVVRPTLSVLTPKPVFGRHCNRRSQWRLTRSSKPPPHVAVLALLSLVAEEMQADGRFTGNAYYGRFIEMLGADPHHEGLRKRVIAGHKADIQQMWSELSQWLAQDPTRGIPTAHAFDHRAYIGPALSQALVRAGDRSALHDLFVSARLSPGDAVSAAEMVELLREWLPSARVSRSLKVLCGQQSTLEHVADVAITELRSWDGQGRHDIAHTRGLRLAGHLRARPSRALQLVILARLPEGEATLQCGGLDEETFLITQDERETVAQPANAVLALANEATLIAHDGTRVTRAPQRIVVLHRQPDGTLREVERVLLGEPHMLLITDAARSIVERALDSTARPGWQPLEDVPGVPPGWLAYADVEIVALSDDVKHADLSALVPVGWSSISLQGGFRLPGRACWLSGAAPRAALSVLEGGEVDVEISVVTEHGESQDESAVASGLAIEAATLDPTDDERAAIATVLRRRVGTLDGIDLEGELTLERGRYLIRARRDRDGDVVAETSFEIRAPTPVVVTDDHDQPSSSVLWPMGGAPGIRGALIQAPTSESVSADGILTLPTAIAPVERVQAPSDEPSAEALPSDAPDCFRTGAHRILLPDNSPQGTTGTCAYCGLEKWFPSRTVHRYARAVRKVRVPRLVSPASTPEEQHVLLALSTVESGTTRALEQIIGQVDDAPWALHERARTLSALGHIDLVFEPHGNIESWTISPPTLVCVDEHESFLCGWRSEELQASIGRLAHSLGGAVHIEPLAQAPERITVTGLAADDLELLCLEASDLTGVSLQLARRPATILASALPAARSLIDGLLIARPSGPIEWRRPGTWRWERAAGVTAPGTYRSRNLPRRYYLHDGRQTYACEPTLSRWLGAPSSYAHLAYDPEARLLTVPLGGRLPGLWERAAVLCAGRPPQRTDGRIAYANVARVVAERLARTLATNTEPISVA